jgi:GNAT superfamily N-acetyltransferase
LRVFERGEVPDVEVVQRRREHDEEMFRLYAQIHGEEATAASRRRWKWQYLDNPLTPADGPVIWMAKEGERLLGQMATMPVRLWFGGREVKASWGNDYFVRIDAQGRGFGMLVTKAWAEHEEVALALGLTPSSYPLFKKVGFVDVGPVPLFQKVVGPAQTARRRLGPALGRLGAPLLAAALRLRFGREPAPPGDVEVRPITGFSSEYDRLWERARASYAMCARRDAAYLNWKYFGGHKSYEAFEARRGGELVGYAVTREEDYRGLRIGWIVDLFSDTRDRGAKDALLAHALAAFRGHGVGRAQAYSLNRPLAEDLARFGFFPARSVCQFCVMSRVDPNGAFAGVGGWNLMFGDGDLDR